MDKLKELEKQVELYEKNIESQQQSLETLKRELEQLKAEKDNEAWKPKDGEWYWFIRFSGEGIPVVWHGDAVDERRYAIGNVFSTKEEAEFRVEQLKVEAELRRFSRPFVVNERNFILKYNYDTNKILIDFLVCTLSNNIHFASGEIARKAIDTIGAERIKKYYFGVDE